MRVCVVIEKNKKVKKSKRMATTKDDTVKLNNKRKKLTKNCPKRKPIDKTDKAQHGHPNKSKFLCDTSTHLDLIQQSVPSIKDETRKVVARPFYSCPVRSHPES